MQSAEALQTQRVQSVQVMALANSSELSSEEGAAAKLAALEAGWRCAYETARDIYAQGFLRTLGEAVALAETFLAYGSDDDPSQRTRRYGAFQRDATELARDYILDRAARHDGSSNATIEIRGPTGSGKSSAAMTIAEWLGLRPHHVHQAVSFYPRPWMRSIIRSWRQIKANQDAPRVVVLDEETASIGEGSRTKEQLVQNQEARLRQTGISMIFCAANKEGPRIRDVTIEMIGTNAEKKLLLGLYFQGNEPIGLVYLPFCDPETWSLYTPLKEANLDLAVNMGGVDAAIMRAHIIEVLADAATMNRLSMSKFSYDAVRLELDDDLGGAYSSNEIKRIATRVCEIGRLWGEDGDPIQFHAQVMGLLEKGLAWTPDDRPAFVQLISG